VSDTTVVAVAVCAVVGVWAGWRIGVCFAMCAGVAMRPRWAAAVGVVVALAAGLAGERAWQAATPRELGEFAGWVQVVADAAPFGSGTRLTLEVRGERFDAWVYGSARARVDDRQAGEWMWVSGERVPLPPDSRRERVRHVVGRFRMAALGDTLAGSPLARAGNRIRGALRRSAEGTMDSPTASLFTGLVIGDDARQPRWMTGEFRASGLSHLTAVSGQNLAFVVAAAMPLLRRLRPWWRWAATVGLIAWFMSITRFEPSVLRAGFMAMLAATAFVLGRQPRPVRLLAIAIVVLVLLDPLLVWSVGFWLSVGATAGVCVVGPRLTRALPGPEWFRVAVGVTVGAQCGVCVPSVLVFHRLPFISLLANLVAVPVAGFVMLYGLPAGLLAASIPAPASWVVMVPAVVGTRWVATVARVAAAVEPGGAWSWAWWSAGLVVLTVVIRHRSRVRRRGVPI
jgi:competence protein ComEC